MQSREEMRGCGWATRGAGPATTRDAWPSDNVTERGTLVGPHQIVEAHRYLASNQQIGKIVVTV
jgi:hypothetical protein